MLLVVAACAGCDRRSGPETGAEASTPPASVQSPVEPAPQPIAERRVEPPPPDPNAWLREVEKDPIAALKKLDPAALQPSRTRPSNDTMPQAQQPEFRPGPAVAKHNPETPLRGWPPVVGRPYPEIALVDQSGRVTSLSEFRGKVVLVELVGLTCPACHAFAGGNEPSVGHFRNITPQDGLGSIDSYAQRFGKLSLDHPDVVFVQLALYGMDGHSPPSLADVQAWARHFGMDRYRNEVVLVGDARFINPETRRLIPGFHLIDRNGILRAIHSNDPRHDNLFTSLLPTLSELANTR
jgi:hypothetical protein